MFYKVLVFCLLVPSLTLGYTVVRKDGRVFKGELVEQNSEQVVIRDESGIVVKFKSNQIDWEKTTKEIRSEEAKKDKNAKNTDFQSKEIRRTGGAAGEWNGEPISVDFKDIDIRDFFRFIAEISGLNMILDPGVKGTLTLKLTDVPWDQALDIVCRTYGYGYVIEGNAMDVDRN